VPFPFLYYLTLCDKARRPCLPAANVANEEAPRVEEVAPVKRTVPPGCSLGEGPLAGSSMALIASCDHAKAATLKSQVCQSELNYTYEYLHVNLNAALDILRIDAIS